MSSISFKNVSIGYESKVVLDNINLTLKNSGVYCLMGMNGVGKSTLLKTIAGLNSEISGITLINEKPIQAYSLLELAQIRSIVFSSFETDTYLSVRSFIELGTFPCGYSLPLRDQKVSEILEELNITDLESSYLHQLSDGQRQKANIARALAQATPIILLDEPLNFLDYPSKIEFMQLIHSSKLLSEKIVIYTAHDWPLVKKFSQQILLISKDGRMLPYKIEDLVSSDTLLKEFNLGKDYL